MVKDVARTWCLLVFMSLALLTDAETKGSGTWLLSSLNKATAAPPTPADPCAEIIFNMMDCMDFLSLDQPTGDKPSASCCTGFESVLAVSPLCVCEGVKTACDIGLVLNMTRAAQLPALCGATSFDNNICEDNAAPSQAPPPQGSPATPPPSPPKKKAPAAATVAPTVSVSHSLNTVSAMFASIAGVLVSFNFA